MSGDLMMKWEAATATTRNMLSFVLPRIQRSGHDDNSDTRNSHNSLLNDGDTDKSSSCKHHQAPMKGKKRWSLFGSYQVLEWHQVDESSRDPGILTGYRPDESSWADCWRSLFSLNNETVNIWSHFIPTIYFFWRAFHLAKGWGYLSASPEEDSDPYAQPFLIYMVSVCLWPLLSTVAHAFYCLSLRARDICFFMDYAGLSFYSFGSGMLYRAYNYSDEWMAQGWTTSIFLTGCVILSLTSTYLTCVSRCFVKDIVIQRLMRLTAFTLPYIWDTAPLLVRLFQSPYGPAEHLHVLQLLFAVLASAFYSSHIPERFLPGKFDMIGHSHNFLHICGIVATTFQMEAGLIDMEARREHLIGSGLALLDPYWTAVVPMAVLSIHILLVFGFSTYFYRPDTSRNRSSDCCRRIKKQQ